ncbi:MAG: ribonuclease HI family protein [Thermoplasmata archaeon]|nr:ribonuclease HI family protein [Thermoplasmata archaeon]
MAPEPGSLEATLPRGTVVFPPLVQVHFDGACEDSPLGRIATYGFVVEGTMGTHEECGLAVRPGSERATNNVAEYTGAIRALEYLHESSFRGEVLMFGDSQLVVRQVEGEYAVRAEHLKPYLERLLALCKEFQEVRWSWIPREENVRADELTKMAIYREMRGLERAPTRGPRRALRD